MTVKRIVCLFTLCCVLLLPLTATAAPVYNEILRLQMGGDVDGDGAITSTDARLVLQYAVEKVSDKDLNTAIADMDEDGSITSTDARLILQYVVGKESLLPRPESLPRTRLEEAPTGEVISFTTVVANVHTKASYKYDYPGSMYVVQTAEEWAYLKEHYGLDPVLDEAFFAQHAVLFLDSSSAPEVTHTPLGVVLAEGALTFSIKSELPFGVTPTLEHVLTAVAIPREVLAKTDTLAYYFEVIQETFE